MQKGFILCADDFAQSDSISAAILALASAQRINGISCLVNMPQWLDVQAELHPLKESTFIGLHLNLTFGQPMSALWRARYGEEFLGLSKLLSLAYTRQLDIAVVSAEIQAQIDVFSQDMHCYPDFIDGHQHVHQFPVIRDALLSIYQKQHERLHGFSPVYPFDVDDDHSEHLPCFLRKTYNGWRDLFSIQGFPKCQILAFLGGRTWQRLLLDAGVSSNSSFFGVYRFASSQRYRRYFCRFLRQIQDGGLVMCHPGEVSEDLDDPLYRCRSQELQYLSGDAFLQDLTKHQVYLIKKKQ